MRFLGIAVMVASLTVRLAAAQTVSVQPLAPGKPAGIHQARHGASTGLLIAGGVLAAGLAAVLVFTKGGNNNGVVTTPTGTTS